MSEYLLVKFDDNWADEMDMEGFNVMSRGKWDKFVEMVKTHFEDDENQPLNVGFGTNEYNDYESYDQVMSSFKTQKITEEEAKTLKRLFSLDSTYGYGQFGMDSLIDSMYDKMSDEGRKAYDDAYKNEDD